MADRLLGRRSFVLVLVVSVVWLPSVVAQEPNLDPLVSVRDADPLELGRVAQALGDGAVIERIEGRHGLAAQLAAIRAAPWLRRPAAALGLLAPLAAGWDPDLAPAAARATLRIARSLSLHPGLLAEVMPESLAPCHALLLEITDKARNRADIRRMAAESAALLAAAGIPAAP